MGILLTGFKGLNNTSKILLDRINYSDKLYLDNNKIKSCNQIEKKLKDKQYDMCIMFGQKPLIKKLNLEIQAHNDREILHCTFDYAKFHKLLTKFNIDSKISNHTGNSYCNNIYYYSLKFYPNMKTIFVHLPYLKNFIHFDSLVEFINLHLEENR